MDIIDILIKLGIFASFIIFGLAMWSIKKDINKRKSQQTSKDNK